ncbi:MAG: hypothetical protein WCE44_02615 [Candidatus Velthaea sp.]
MANVGLTAQALLLYLRQSLSDLDSNGRWADSTLLNFLDRANKRLVGEVRFPDARVLVPTVPGVQLYQFPLMLDVRAVYVAGQLIVPTDLNTLEHVQLDGWQAWGVSGSNAPAGMTTTANQPISAGKPLLNEAGGIVYNEAGGIVYSEGNNPVGGGVTFSGLNVPDGAMGTGANAPQWAVQSPLSYPDANGTWCCPAPDAQPWHQFQRPRYYWRGGWLGLVPAPSVACTISVDGIVQPDTITQSMLPNGMPVTLTSPENFTDAIVFAALAIAKNADDGQRAEQQAQTAERNYEREKRKLLAWLGRREGQIRNGPKPQTMRPAYAGYHMRRNRGGWR